MHGTLIMKENVSLRLFATLLNSNTLTRLRSRDSLSSPPWQSLKLVSSEQALKELGLNEHQLRFTCRVQLHDPHSDSDTLHRIYTHLKRSEQRRHSTTEALILGILKIFPRHCHFIISLLSFLYVVSDCLS